MVVDTSALIALLGMEAEAARIAAALESDPSRMMSAATLVEACMGDLRNSRLNSAAFIRQIR